MPVPFTYSSECTKRLQTALPEEISSYKRKGERIRGQLLVGIMTYRGKLRRVQDCHLSTQCVANIREAFQDACLFPEGETAPSNDALATLVGEPVKADL